MTLQRERGIAIGTMNIPLQSEISNTTNIYHNYRHQNLLSKFDAVSRIIALRNRFFFLLQLIQLSETFCRVYILNRFLWQENYEKDIFHKKLKLINIFVLLYIQAFDRKEIR